MHTPVPPEGMLRIQQFESGTLGLPPIRYEDWGGRYTCMTKQLHSIFVRQGFLSSSPSPYGVLGTAGTGLSPPPHGVLSTGGTGLYPSQRRPQHSGNRPLSLPTASSAQWEPAALPAPVTYTSVNIRSLVITSTSVFVARVCVLTNRINNHITFLSLHYFHSFVMKDHVDCSDLSPPPPPPRVTHRHLQPCSFK